MVSLCSEYYEFFLAQGLLLGIGFGVLVCPAIATLPKYFVRHRGLAIGFAVAGSSLGGVTWPIAMARLLNYDNISFGWTMRILGFTMLPLLLIAIATIRNPRPSAQESSSGTVPQAKSRKHKTDFSVLKNPAFLLTCGGLTLAYLGMFSPFFFVSSYGKNSHVIGAQYMTFERKLTQSEKEYQSGCRRRCHSTLSR